MGSFLYAGLHLLKIICDIIGPLYYKIRENYKYN